MSAQPPVQIQVRYSEYWTVILQKHEKFFALTQTLGPTVDEIFGGGMSEPMHKVCRHLAKMVSNSLGAVLLLGMNGFGIDAIRIARTMLEAADNIAYLRQHPEEFDDYYDFHLVVAMKRQQYMETYSPQSLSRLTPEFIADRKREYDRVAQRFTDKKGTPVADGARRPFMPFAPSLGLRNTI